MRYVIKRIIFYGIVEVNPENSWFLVLRMDNSFTGSLVIIGKYSVMGVHYGVHYGILYKMKLYHQTDESLNEIRYNIRFTTLRIGRSRFTLKLYDSLPEKISFTVK